MHLRQKPLVIPIFIPHSGCPHQCAFCNQAIITQKKIPLPDASDIDAAVHHYLKFKGSRRTVELAFFGGNFLGLAPEVIRSFLNYIEPYILDKKIDGIRFSTRPDTITEKTLQLVRAYPISAVEIGVQSMNDDVLRASGRGHHSLDTIRAMALLRQIPVKIGVQVMVGLPKDHEESLLESTAKIAGLFPDFARIYPLMVLKGSPLEKWYHQGRYEPLSLSGAVSLVKKMVRIFRARDIDVIRMGLQASDMMNDPSMVLAGPWHPAFGHMVWSELFYDMVCDRLYQRPDLLKSSTLVLYVHPRSLSRLRGDHNMNMKRLNRRFATHQFLIRTDDGMAMDEIRIS